VALVLAALQAVLDRRDELATLETRFNQIADSSEQALALAIWNLDRQHVELMLGGMLLLPDVHAVELMPAEASWFRDGERVRLGAQEPSNHLIWEREIDYEAEGATRRLGRLRLEFDATAIASRLAQRSIRNLLSLMALSLMIGGFLLWTVNRLVTRHLIRLADAAKRFDLSGSEVDFKLRRRGTGGDELDQVAMALEGMRANLGLAYGALAQANRDLQRDMRAREEAERRAAHLARHDSLTGLPNRRFLNERLQQHLERRRQHGGNGALLFIDLDNFKSLNDARGHSIGDAVLIAVAQRLSTACAGSGFAARMGGDEFVVMMEGLQGDAALCALQARNFGERMRAEIGEPIAVLGELHRLSASIGVAMIPGDGEDIESLIRHADTAMYQAKSEGRNLVQLFQPSLLSRIELRHALDCDLREALEQKHFALHFQPIVNGDGALRGAEALLRWHHPRRGQVSPAQFIPHCEETGLILDLGAWVIRHALQTLADWRRRGCWPDRCYLSLNISPRQFKQRNFVDRLLAELELVGEAPQALALEITEGALIGDSEVALANLRLLRAQGFRLLIDDFGVGYSSLSYLKRLPVHGLKLDQSFVRDIPAAANDAALVEALLAIGQRFGLEVIAEGVETLQHLEILATHGCRRFQGFHFARPQAPEQFEQVWLLGGIPTQQHSSSVL
jgi:diguanylate cyclase (GGDEF)-like protein